MTRLQQEQKPKLPEIERDFIPVVQMEGNTLVLLVDGKSFRLKESQAKKLQKDINKLLGPE